MLLINWLKKPYFFINSPKFNFLLCLGVGLFIFIFLFLFQPFGIKSLENDKLLYSGGFGLVSFAIPLLYFLLFPALFKDFFNDEKWTVGKNIFFLFLLILSITIGNWYLNSFMQSTKTIGLRSLEDFFFYTFSLAVFPIIIFTYVSEKLYRIYREKSSKEIMKFRVSTPIKKVNEKLKIVGDNKKEEITFNIENLVYISSQGNYASFYLKTENGLKEVILRNTLTKIETYLSNYSNIIRCHKSYIINANFMETISGNARGYFLKSKLVPHQIPISRSFKKEKLKNLIS